MKTELILLAAGIAVYVIYTQYYAPLVMTATRANRAAIITKMPNSDDLGRKENRNTVEDAASFCPSGTCGYNASLPVSSPVSQQTCGAR